MSHTQDAVIPGPVIVPVPPQTADRSADRHKGVKHTVYIPSSMVEELEIVRPKPVPKTQMIILALRHYLDDCRSYGVHPRTLMPLPPPVRMTDEK